MGSTGAFSIKSRICVFCASGIVSVEDDLLEQATQLQDIGVSMEVFLKGVAVMCDILKVESKLTSEENWDLKGDFVSFVCCEKCGILMSKLVSLHQLMVETRTCLEQNVRKIEHSIVESTKRAEDVEYSVSACLELREEIIRNYQKGLEFISVDELEEVSNLETELYEPQEHNEDPNSNISNYEALQSEIVPHDQWGGVTPIIRKGVKTRQCFVNLQQISPIMIKCGEGLSETLQSRDPLQEEKISDERTLGRSKKRSYPKQYSEEVTVKNKLRKQGKSVVREEYASSVLQPGELRDETESVDNLDPEDERSIDDADYKPSISSIATSSPSENHDCSSSSSESDEEPEYTPTRAGKRRSSRLRTSNSRITSYRKTRRILQESKALPVNFRPVFVLNDSLEIYLYMDVKFQRESSSLHCKHPWCDFSIGEMGDFEDGNVFGKIKEHIRNTHRKGCKRIGAKGVPQYYCWLCNEWMDHKSSLVTHLRFAHDNAKYPLAICGICGDSMSAKRITQHQLSHQMRTKSVESTKSKPARAPPNLNSSPEDGSSRGEKKASSYSKTPTENPGGHKPRKGVEPVYVVNQSTNTYMFLHVKIKKEATELSCKFPNCNFSAGRMEYFSDQDVISRIKEHIKEVHRNVGITGAGATLLLYCWPCDDYVESNNFNKFESHLKTKHGITQQPLTMCEICGIFKKQNVLLKHRRTHLNIEEKRAKLAESVPTNDTNETKPAITKHIYPCGMCDQIFHNYRLFINHANKVHIPLEMRQCFVCDICGKRSGTKQKLAAHQEAVHFRESAKAKYVCPICDRKFIRSETSFFKSHVLSHSGERNFQCSECGKGFVSKLHLIHHAEVHREDLKIQCEFCSFVVIKSRLRRHQRRKHPDLVSDLPQRPRPDVFGPKLAFPCEPCGKVYVYKSQFIMHMKQAHNLLLPRNEDYPMQNILENDNKPY